jgi:RNA polymerase sigma-70 factor (ECF subfamily)
VQDDTGAALTDDTLARRAGNGDREAFTALVTRHQASVFRLARVLTSSRDAAEDVLQQTFLSAWQHLGRFRGEASVRTWLLTIARHAALARRAQAHHERVDPTPLDELGLRAGWGGPSPEQAAMSGERAAALARAWAKLDADAQEVLTLRELEEMSGEATAALLGISLAAMKSRLHRARMALAAAVTEVTSHAAR